MCWRLSSTSTVVVVNHLLAVDKLGAPMQGCLLVQAGEFGMKMIVDE
jgi:hypothetical protein